MQFFDCLLHFLTTLWVENGALVEKICSVLLMADFLSFPLKSSRRLYSEDSYSFIVDRPFWLAMMESRVPPFAYLIFPAKKWDEPSSIPFWFIILQWFLFCKFHRFDIFVKAFIDIHILFWVVDYDIKFFAVVESVVDLSHTLRNLYFSQTRTFAECWST